MIVKEFAKPIEIKKLEVLAKRLPENHAKYAEVQETLRKKLAGYKGEKAVFYYLNLLPEKEYHIFYNLRLPIGKSYTQIDFLVITPTMALIIESKNFYGTLYFDNEFEQLIRMKDGIEEGFQNPISQGKWHQIQLKSFLENSGFPSVPVDYLVAISNPSTILKTNSLDNKQFKKLIHSYNLVEKIKNVKSASHLSSSTIRTISKLLLAKNTPNEGNPLEKYEINKSDILTGIQCPQCSRFSMIREFSIWTCPKCKHKNKTAHLNALEEYFLLFSPTITNQQFRSFVHISSESTARKLLNGTQLKTSGKTKGRVYRKTVI